MVDRLGCYALLEEVPWGSEVKGKKNDSRQPYGVYEGHDQPHQNNRP